MFTVLVLTGSIWLVATASLLGIRWAKHPLLFLTVCVMLVIHCGVPLALTLLGEIDHFVVESVAVDNEVLKYRGLLFTYALLFFVTVGYVLGSGRQPRQQSAIGLLGRSDVRIMAVVGNVLATMGLVGLLLLEPRSSGRLAYSSESIFSLGVLSRYLAYGITLSAYYDIVMGRIRHHTLLNVLGYCAVYLLKMGDRAPVVALGLALLLGYVSTKGSASINGRIVLLAGFLVFVSMCWQYVRWHWPSGSGLVGLLVTIKDSLVLGPMFSIVRGELGYLYKASQAVMYLIPEEYDYLCGRSYLRLLLALFPSSLFAFKPPDTQLLVAEMFGVTIQGASRPATFVGDAYMNFGWMGSSMGILLGYVVAKVHRFRRFRSAPTLAVAALGPYWIIVWLRGSLNGMAPCLFWLLIGGAISFASRRRVR